MKLWHAMREAQSADGAKTEFLANMSHELRTPLNAIIGFSELTRDEVFGPIDNRRYVEYATDIHDSARFLLDIIGDILELSKIEAGKLELRLGEVSLRDVIESAGRIITPQAAKKNVSVNLKHDRAIHTIHADERALKQVVLQLLSNAIKFSSDNGTVTVETTRDTSGTICLTVSDTGMGISKEYLPHIMEPFYQVTNSQTASETGTGLGLPVAAALVALHGGKIQVESDLGVGTTVRVEFPSE